MNNIEIVEPPPKEATIKDIAGLERSLGQVFPADYRDFLLQDNGGFSHEYSIPYTSSAWGEGQSVAIFLWASLGIAPAAGSFMSLENALNNRRKHGKFPALLVPIAEGDSGCGAIVISLRSEDHGRVYFWDDEAPDHQAMSFLAISFSALVDALVLKRRRD